MQGSWFHGRSCGWPREGNIFKVIFISKFFSCRFQDNPSSVRNNSNGGRKKERRKLQKKKKGKRLLFLVLILHFISVGKSPLIFFFLFKFNASWEHAVQDFGMGTSNEVGKGGKMRKWKLWGSWQSGWKSVFRSLHPLSCEYKARADSWVRALLAQRFPASVSSTITQRTRVLNHGAKIDSEPQLQTDALWWVWKRVWTLLKFLISWLMDMLFLY